MKNATISLITFLATIALMAGTQGCYTQVGVTREEQVYRADDEDVAGGEEQGEEAGEEIEEGNDYGQDWDTNVRVGFDYYYPYTYWPSVSFSMAYNDPWYGWSDPYYSYGYPYYGYDYGYGYPYYGYGYGCGYYYPPGYYYGAPVPVTNRSFGSTRGTGGTGTPRGMTATGGTRAAVGAQGVNAASGDMRGDMRGGINDAQHMDLRTGAGRVVTGATGGGTSADKASGVKSTGSSRKSGTSRKSISDRIKKYAPGSRSGSTGKDNKRLYRDRGSVSGSAKGDRSNPSPSVEPDKSNTSGGTSRSGGTRSSGNAPSTRQSSPSGRSSSPPPSAAPRSSPPPSSGGGARSGGGGGGGGSRSPRP